MFTSAEMPSRFFKARNYDSTPCQPASLPKIQDSFSHFSTLNATANDKPSANFFGPANIPISDSSQSITNPSNPNKTNFSMISRYNLHPSTPLNNNSNRTALRALVSSFNDSNTAENRSTLSMFRTTAKKKIPYLGKLDYEQLSQPALNSQIQLSSFGKIHSSNTPTDSKLKIQTRTPLKFQKNMLAYFSGKSVQNKRNYNQDRFKCLNELPKSYNSGLRNQLGLLNSFSRTRQEQNYQANLNSVELNPPTPQNNNSTSSINKINKFLSYFAIFDGHGGSRCSEFLNENIHNYVTYIFRNYIFFVYFQIARQKECISNPKLALENALRKAENTFLEIADPNKDTDANRGSIVRRAGGVMTCVPSSVDTSGSCALVCLFGTQKTYLANVGDSHAILYKSGAKGPQDMNVDHKPENKTEYRRIIENGGKLLRQELRNTARGQPFKTFRSGRIHPGNLNVSRTIGDIEAKLKKYGGLPNVISSKPDIYEFDNTDIEYILLTSDGVYESMTKQQIHQVYMKIRSSTPQLVEQALADEFTNQVVQAACKSSTDNITVICILPL